MTKTKGRNALAAMMLVHALVVRAEAPTVTSVEPAQVFADEATTVTIRGAGFSADSRVGLLDASGPRVVSRLRPTSQRVSDVASGTEFAVVNLEEPARPVTSGRISMQGAWRVAASGDVALVSDTWAIRLVDVSDPAAPRVMSTFVCAV